MVSSKNIAFYGESQSGFQQKHNTCAALTKIADIILGNIDRGLLTDAVYVDLKMFLILLIMKYC